MKRLLLIFTIGLTLMAIQSDAQSPYEVEQQIKSYMERTEYWRYKYEPEDTSFGYEVEPYDSLTHINDELYDYMLKVCSTMPQLLKAKLNIDEMAIVTSEDQKLRIYSWDTYMGGTMHYYNAIAQYATVTGSQAIDINHLPKKEENSEPGAVYNSVYTIKQKDGKTYYLLTYRGTFSNIVAGAGIKAVSIADDNLLSVDVFQATNKTLNDINYNYDLSSNYNYDNGGEYYVIHLSKNNKKLYIPLVDGDQMTGKWLVYVFNGYKFIYDEKAK